jgi:5-oxopent-3-ene-1,2,5-tricarboxylate decarboxylase / 2-hydroxyhepta-2,4-diene-1,7-dioate isomerase
MTTTVNGCACHGNLGIGPTKVSDLVLETLKGISIPTISMVLRRLGYSGMFLSGVAPRTSMRNFAGRAFTGRTVPTRSDVAKTQEGGGSLHRQAFETIETGDVLVIDARGDVGARVTGDILASRLKYRGAAALVTDGAVGDLAALQTVGLPIYSRGLTPVTFGELHVMADLNVPVACAGVLIMPGDVLVGDPEGVIAIPQGVAAQVAEEGAETERRDAFSRGKVEAGSPLAEAYPLSGTLRAQYEATKARTGGPHSPENR